MNESTFDTEQNDDAPRWQALDALQRRVLGVLVEKAKTTPDAYPLTVNSIKTASNQKSNRKPLMDLDADDVLATLDELRELGAVAEVQGDGRTNKFRHKAYEWLGVDKFELAVMAELLLRGEQTVGELRGRAARMETIAGMSELKPILSRLVEKRLLVEVTPAGRGQIVTHGLFQDGESPAVSQAAASGYSEAESSSPPDRSASSSSPGRPSANLEQRLASLEKRIADLEERLADPGSQAASGRRSPL